MRNKKAARYLLIFLLILCAVEGLLRLTGTVFFGTPQLKAPDPQRIRIAAFGESTTDYRVGRGTAWPELLEKILNERGHQVQVFNFGRLGVNSSLILSRLEENLAASRPQYVVSMMGINDTGTLGYADTSLRTLRLLSLLQERIRSHFSCGLHDFSDSINPTPDQVKKWSGIDDPKLAAREMFVTLESYEKVTQGLLKTAGFLLSDNYQPRRARAFLDYANERDPLNHMIIFLRLHNHIKDGDSSCGKILREIEECAMNLPDDVLSKVSECLVQVKSPALAEKFSRGGLFFTKADGDILKKNYQAFLGKLHDRKIPLLAMQYPTLPLSKLEELFQDSPVKPVMFIGNEKNFAAALESGKYSEIFLDRFRGSWGHTTTEGHRLIALQVADALEPLLKR